MPHILHTVPRPDPQIVAALGKLGTATIHEAQGQSGALAHTIRPIYAGMKCCGPARSQAILLSPTAKTGSTQMSGAKS